MRIVFYASYPDQPIGYSKVAHAIASWFLANGVELYYFGVGNYEETRCTERSLPDHPNLHWIDVEKEATEPYGMDILAAKLDRLQPDVFFIYNDIIVTCRAFNALLNYRKTHRSTRFVSYLDLVYPYERLELIKHVDKNTDEILVFSPCWKRNLEEMGIVPQKIRCFPHGISDFILPILPTTAKYYFGIAEDTFLVLNANRNTYRKAQDIAIRAFLRFLIREHWDSRIRMFLHCELRTKSGYAIEDVLEIEACRAGIPVQVLRDRILIFSSTQTAAMSDREMNLLYNAADIGLNTCMGEGFGLCQVEHAALGKPQIVSRVGALADIFAEGGAIFVEPRVWIRASNSLDEHSGDLGICAAEDFAAAMSVYFHDEQKRERDGMWGAQVFPGRYHWSELLTQSLLHII